MLTEIETTQCFKLIFDYLSGKPLPEVKIKLANRSLTKAKFKEVKISVPDNPFEFLDPRLDAILDVLDIEESKRKELITKSKNLYNFLLLLRANHEVYHLKKLIQLVDATTKKPLVSKTTKGMLLIGSLLTGGAIFDYLDGNAYQKTVDFLRRCALKAFGWLKVTFQLAKNITLLAIGINAAVTVYKLQKILFSKTKSKIKKIINSLFTLSTSALSIGAYLLVYFALGVANPVSSIMMVLSNVLSAFKEGYSLRQYERAFKNGPKPNDPKDTKISYGKRAAYQRALSSIKQHRDTLKTKIAITMACTAVIAVWSFCPPSLLLTAFCIGSLLLLGGIQKIIVTARKRHYQNTLQETLENIPESTNGISPALAFLGRPKKDMFSLDKRREGLEVTHGNLRLRLPQGMTLESKEDADGPYQQVFFRPEISLPKDEELKDLSQKEASLKAAPTTLEA